jgi:septal ring factor EnvC (AmiA/AmiB activator)
MISELKSELQAAMVDLGHKSAFDLILKDAWNREQAVMGNSTLPTVCDKLNLVASVHNRKLIAAVTKELKDKDVKIKQLSDKVVELENSVKMIMDKLKDTKTDLSMPK